MVKEYLDRTKQEFIEQKLMIQKDIVGCQNRMKENAKFIEILEDTNDPNYDAFTPRETNSFNRKKIVELQDNQKMEFDHLSSLQDELQIVENKIEEISNVMREYSVDSSKQNLIDSRLDQLRTNDRVMHRFSKKLMNQSETVMEQVRHHMDLCNELVDVDSERAKIELSEIRKQISLQQDWINNFTYELYPAFDDGISFDQKVQHLIQQLNKNGTYMIDYHTSGISYRLDKVIQNTLLYIIRELSINGMNYSGVNKIMIGLAYEADGVLMNVSDNGYGFDYESFTQSTEYGVTKLGIYMLEKKVDMLNGKMKIDSALQKGCSIKIYIPKIS